MEQRAGRTGKNRLFHLVRDVYRNHHAHRHSEQQTDSDDPERTLCQRGQRQAGRQGARRARPHEQRHHRFFPLHRGQKGKILRGEKRAALLRPPLFAHRPQADVRQLRGGRLQPLYLRGGEGRCGSARRGV